MRGPEREFTVDSVRHSAELARVLALPRRDWQESAASLAAGLTPLLSAPGGSMALRPVQAAMLSEAYSAQGLLAPVGVGRGKTLVSLLLPFVLGSVRPLLVLPAALISKTKREWAALARHWKIPNFIVLRSYQWFGRVGAKQELDRYAPDLIIFDEAHYVKNRHAAVTRRFERYITAARKESRPLRVCAMSGTITSRSLLDFAHLAQWALPHGCPVPWTHVDLEQWSGALDAGEAKLAPGALLAFSDERPEPSEEQGAARRGFQRRLRETAGVVATTDDPVKASLRISGLEQVESSAVDAAFELLRGKWELPDGHECLDGVEIWRHAREIALGYYYRWDPWPPRAWLDARKAWGQFVREELRRKHGDSEHEVALANPDHELLRAWRREEARFKPNQVLVWLDESVALRFAAWLREGPGVLFTESPAFGKRVAALAGCSYYGRKGLDSRGRLLDDERGPAVASVYANREGRNLQHYSRCLFASCPSSAKEFEQAIGRFHREGQTADEVSVEIYLACIEHTAAWYTAKARAQYTFEISGQPQKILYADDLIEVSNRTGARWNI